MQKLTLYKMSENDNNAEHFLDLIRKSRKGKFKIYIGMAAGVGKSYRMLQEAHTLLQNGVDIKIGYIETYNRTNTKALLEGLPIIPRKQVYYKGKELEEMAPAFNKMAEKLYEYENSNINPLMFEKQRVETIINQMNDGVVGLDGKGKILFINNSGQQLLNLKATDIKGKYAPDIALRNDLLRFILQKDKKKSH